MLKSRFLLPAILLLAGCGGGGSVPGPQIVAKPHEAEVALGETAEFTVLAKGDGVTYQWWHGTRIAGATGPTLRVTPQNADDFREYSVEVTRNGRSVSLLTWLYQTGRPKIVVPPGGTGLHEAPLGGTVTLSVSATGDAPLAYQWYRMGYPNPPVPGATGPTLTIGPLTHADEGMYYVVVSNAKDGATGALESVNIAEP